MMRMLFVMAIVLTANVVSAQTFFKPAQKDPVVKEVINFPYTEITEIRLWAPDSKSGVFQWWQLTREHRGPSWVRAGLIWKHVDDRIIEKWVPGAAPREEKPIEYQTIDIWKLREEAMKQIEAREPRPTRLEEPVFRIPKAEELDERRELPAPKKKEPAKPAPKAREQVRPSGPTYLVKNDSSGN